MKIIAEESLAKLIPYSRDSRHSSFEGLSLVSDFCSPRQLAMITALVTDPAEEDFTLRQPHDSQAAPGLHQRQYGFRRILFGAAGSPCFQFARSLLGIRHRVPLLFQNLYGQARPHMKGYKTHQQVQNVDMLLYGEGDHESWQYDGVVPEECNKEAIVTVLNLGCTAVWEFLRRRQPLRVEVPHNSLLIIGGSFRNFPYRKLTHTTQSENHPNVGGTISNDQRLEIICRQVVSLQIPSGAWFIVKKNVSKPLVVTKSRPQRQSDGLMEHSESEDHFFKRSQ